MHVLPFEDFLKYSAKGNLIPVYREILGDLETPVSAYFKLASKSKYSFLLESVDGGEKFARYSFIARDPHLIVRSKGSSASVIRFKDGKKTVEDRVISGSPLTLLRELMQAYQAVDIPKLPKFFGGLVGYLSYDCVRFFEKLPDTSTDELKLDDMVMMQADDLIVFDHKHRTIKVIACVFCAKKDSKRVKLKKYNNALKAIDVLIKDLNKPLKVPALPTAKKVQINSNCTQAKYEDMVRTAKKHITAGDIIQVVLSQRFAVKIDVPPLEIYRCLRALNPSPYMFFLNYDGLQLIGASPELLVSVQEGVAQVRPIAGTRHRGETAKEDEALEKELLADPKEKAEHVMLVDLGRNDLGRVCERGTVKLCEFMTIERYSHVMHIVSQVQGKLRKDKDALDVLEASFPAGTVSGAPKIRAMEIIEDLEGVKRGAYAGAVGFVSFSKNLDMCITIRTIGVRQKIAYVQAGAGIVADSDPAKEYIETINKAKAQIKAIELAH